MGKHPFAGTPQYDQQYGLEGEGYAGNGLGRVPSRQSVPRVITKLRARAVPAGWDEDTVRLEDFAAGRPLIDLERIDPDELAA